LEQGRRIVSPSRREAEPLLDDPEPSDPWLVTPRAAAAAVMGMLGFGVVVGALVGGGAAAVLRPVLVAVAPRPAHVASAVAAGTQAGLSGPAAAARRARTITITSPAPTQPPGAGGSVPAALPPATPAPKRVAHLSPLGTFPPVQHAFLIVLSDQGYQETFGHTTLDPYLAVTLAKQGELLPFYYGVTGSPLANGIALISGQGPTPQTIAGCTAFDKITPGKTGANGQILGHGCVYPPTAKTLADQLTAANATWKDYVQVAPSDRHFQAEACQPKLGSKLAVHPKGPYAAWRNPFLFFQSKAPKSKAKPGAQSCPRNDVPLTQLKTDLKKSTTTPNLAYITPDLCDDGSPVSCAPHTKAGMGPADSFLKSVVPEIERSPAYKADGLIAVTFDNAPQTGTGKDTSSCCNNPMYPNLSKSGTGTSNTGTTTTGTGSSQGGGQVGLLLLSPYVAPGTQDPINFYNHFSLLASLEGMFGFSGLGYAGVVGLPTFTLGDFRNYLGCPKAGKTPPC
jgi:hypothetical protein